MYRFEGTEIKMFFFNFRTMNNRSFFERTKFIHNKKGESQNQY